MDINKKKKTHLFLKANRFIMNHLESFHRKTKTLKDLKKGATVAVPNDTTNEARALLLLQDQGLIKLKRWCRINSNKERYRE